MASSGCRVQALTPASVNEAPISFRKPRRPTGSSHSEAFCGNSRCRNSLNSGVSETASRLRQYSRPRLPSSLVRSDWMSIGCVMGGSPMARRAAGIGAPGRDPVFLCQLWPDDRLRHGRLVAHRVDLAARPYVVLGGAMAVDAPLHLQGVFLQGQRHLIDPAMTGLASHALFHVDAVIEIDKVGQVVDADPAQRPVLAKAGANRLENWRLRPDLRVAVHAGLRRRYPGKRGGFDRRVAVPAVNAIVLDVMAVAELHRLLDVLVGARDVRRAGDENCRKNQAGEEEQEAGETKLREGIGAATEDLGHWILTGRDRPDDVRDQSTNCQIFPGPVPICTTL